jgi:hypothetical protein
MHHAARYRQRINGRADVVATHSDGVSIHYAGDVFGVIAPPFTFFRSQVAVLIPQFPRSLRKTHGKVLIRSGFGGIFEHVPFGLVDSAGSCISSRPPTISEPDECPSDNGNWLNPKVF